MLKISYFSDGFPPHIIATGTQDLSVTWNDILWSAVTIGRPSTQKAFQHGEQSWYEAIFRIALIRMALEQYSPRTRRLRRTSAFKNLDPTEKGAINYFLGMVFCKLFADLKLDTPWLLHLDIFKDTYAANAIKGRSRPDLFGQQLKTGKWHAFETKGRANKPSQNDIIKAKLQAQRLRSVGGSACVLHVGTFSYFVNDVLNFYWIDPPSEGINPIELPEIDTEWEYYYGPIRSLWLDKPSTQPFSETDLIIAVPEFDLKIHIHPKLADLLRNREWRKAQEMMREYRDILLAENFKADGLKFVCGSSWQNRISEPTQSS